MNENKTDWRTDLQLIAILDETAQWAVRGENGAVLCQAASLRAAMAMTSKLVGQKIIALTQGPDDGVIVFNVQIVRLAQMVRLIET